MILRLLRRLPEGTIERLEIAKNRLLVPVLFVVSRFELLSSVFYGLFSTAYWREHRATAMGRYLYLRDARDPTTLKYLLRRNTHRLEKGLLMRPLRPVFALSYIARTVTAFRAAVRLAPAHPEILRKEELEWTSAVLERFFEVTGAHPILDQLRADFERLPPGSPDRAPTAAPYRRDLSVPSAVSVGDLLELARRRRSVRWFLDRPVPRDLVDEAVRVASLSPSACNRQPFEFRIFDDPELVQKVAAVPMGTVGFRHNLTSICVVVGKLRSFFSERDRHLIYIDASLATMAFVLALESQGLSSCCLNWPDMWHTERRMKALLRLGDDERVVMLVAIGWPDPTGLVGYSQKKPLDEIRSFNRIGDDR